MIDLDTLPTILCRHRRPRKGPPTAIAIHTAECPSRDGMARNVARYLSTITRTAGIHYCVDGSEIIMCANPATETVPHCYAPSSWSIGIEHVGYARDAPTDAVIAMTVKLQAALCARYNIPVVRLFPLGVRDRRPGIFGHRDATIAYSVSGGHTDPGPDWRWTAMIIGIDAVLHPLNAGDEMIVVGAPQSNGRHAFAGPLDVRNTRVPLENGFRLGGDPTWFDLGLDGVTQVALRLERVPIAGSPVGMGQADGHLIVATSDGGTYAFAIL